MYGLEIPTARFKRELLIPGIFSDQQYTQLQQIIYGSPEWGSRMTAIPGMQAAVERLIADGHFLRIVTSRGEEKLEVAKQWLARAGIEVEIVGTNQASKVEATIGHDVFLDDDLDKLVEIPHVPHRFMMSHPYNEHDTLPEDVERVAGWDEFYARVGQIALLGSS